MRSSVDSWLIALQAFIWSAAWSACWTPLLAEGNPVHLYDLGSFFMFRNLGFRGDVLIRILPGSVFDLELSFIIVVETSFLIYPYFAFITVVIFVLLNYCAEHLFI